MKKKAYDTLVLNKSWVPINIIDWKETMKYLVQDAAQALDADFIPYHFKDWLVYSTLPAVLDDGYHMINTVSHKIAVPDIIVLNKYNRLPYREVKFTRQSIFERDRFTCQYCGKRFKRDDLQMEHVIPKAQGGKSTWDNVVAACGPCNAMKRDRTPDEAGMKLIHKPTEPRWFGPYEKVKNRPHIRPAWKALLGKVGEFSE